MHGGQRCGGVSQHAPVETFGSTSRGSYVRCLLGVLRTGARDNLSDRADHNVGPVQMDGM